MGHDLPPSGNTGSHPWALTHTDRASFSFVRIAVASSAAALLAAMSLSSFATSWLSPPVEAWSSSILLSRMAISSDKSSISFFFSSSEVSQ